MGNRAWKACTRAALAIAVSVVTVATSGAVASAGPVGAVGTPGSFTIAPNLGQFTLISPTVQLSGVPGVNGDVAAYHGFSTLQNLKIQSQGFDLEGRIQGRLRSYDFKSLWQVYNLPSSSGWSLWVLNFKRDTSQSVLKETFRSEQLIDVNIDIKFKVSAANLRGVSTLRVGFETLRLTFDGTTKDFTVVNGASGGARDQNNNEVPVDFEPV
ncbi:hypothetical protein [Actinokineospora sp. NBRC 105648]|uniref:hypothetical protein n=1 Tax=Actinokineospora sp. NBRC 105648 TaxID=3032206 RepID=UPI0024A04D00|nr:hypothetical protein [Actinokineospora sp. NBRC 105648]GLZ38093.1 hypothetical protein Acsp05_17170 [Actinokineospora sp. NBRC 105648]